MRYDMPEAYGDDPLGGAKKSDGVNRIMKTLLEQGATVQEMQSEMVLAGKAESAARGHLMFLNKNGVGLLVNGHPYRKGQRLKPDDYLTLADHGHEPPGGRIAASELRKIQRNHIIRALSAIDEGIEHGFADSTGFDLLFNGSRYPPKAVFGVAGRFVLGAELLPQHFSGGEDSVCFKVLREAGFEVVPKQRSFLLTWNPAVYSLEDYRAFLDGLESNQGVSTWSTGPRKEIPVGSKLFLMRLGTEPKGIVGVAETLQPIQAVPHWDVTRAEVGSRANTVQFRAVHFQEKPLLPLALLSANWPTFDWTPQSSGVEILDPEAVKFIESAVGTGLRTSKQYPDEIPSSATHHEGAVVQVTINAYERDSTARRKCLAHHGYRCAVCSVTMEEVYGPTAVGLIHVHHKRPLHTIGEEYEVDPINDLVPVCPNCHAVLHRPEKCLAVDELRAILKSLPSLSK